MPILSNSMQNSLASWYTGTAFPTAPTTLWVALFASVPTGESAGVELSGGGYARKAIACATVLAFADRLTSNVQSISFAVATDVVGTALGVALMSSATGGTRRVQGALDQALVITTSDTVTLLAGALVLDFRPV